MRRLIQTLLVLIATAGTANAQSKQSLLFAAVDQAGKNTTVVDEKKSSGPTDPTEELTTEAKTKTKQSSVAYAAARRMRGAADQTTASETNAETVSTNETAVDEANKQTANAAKTEMAGDDAAAGADAETDHAANPEVNAEAYSDANAEANAEATASDADAGAANASNVHWEPNPNGKVETKDMEVLFNLDKSDINTDLRGNGETFENMRALLQELKETNAIVKALFLEGFSSPDGRYTYNEGLSERRARSLSNYIEQNIGLNPQYSGIASVAENWQGVRDYVEMTDIQGREGILRIIDSNVHPDTKLAQIKQRYPKAYRHLMDMVFPSLRVVKVHIEYIPGTKVEMPLPAPVEEPIKEVVPQEPVVEPKEEPVEEPVVEKDCDEGLEPILAIKNNLLYDLILAPNLEVERWFGKRRQFSVMAEWQAPWYVWHNNGRAYEVLNVGVEARYWLHLPKACGNRWLTGFFGGVYFMTGKYDFQWDAEDMHKGIAVQSKGYQGEYWSPGVTLGFATRIGRKWNMEFSMGFGYLDTRWRRYYGMFNNEHLIWQWNGTSNYTGITKAKVSLVYLLDKSDIRKVANWFRSKKNRK